LNFILY